MRNGADSEFFGYPKKCQKCGAKITYPDYSCFLCDEQEDTTGLEPAQISQLQYQGILDPNEL